MVAPLPALLPVLIVLFVAPSHGLMSMHSPAMSSRRAPRLPPMTMKETDEPAAYEEITRANAELRAKLAELQKPHDATEKNGDAQLPIPDITRASAELKKTLFTMDNGGAQQPTDTAAEGATRKDAAAVVAEVEMPTRAMSDGTDDDRVRTVCVALLGQLAKIEEEMQEMDFDGFSQLVDDQEVQCSLQDKKAIFAMIDADGGGTVRRPPHP